MFKWGGRWSRLGGGAASLRSDMMNSRGEQNIDTGPAQASQPTDASAARLHRLIGELVNFTAEVDQAYQAGAKSLPQGED